MFQLNYSCFIIFGFLNFFQLFIYSSTRNFRHKVTISAFIKEKFASISWLHLARCFQNQVFFRKMIAGENFCKTLPVKMSKFLSKKTCKYKYFIIFFPKSEEFSPMQSGADLGFLSRGGTSFKKNFKTFVELFFRSTKLIKSPCFGQFFCAAGKFLKN